MEMSDNQRMSRSEMEKKSTDCVYFLASLTCKKGNECEFRHSETARTNPRDCWFWVTGSCLNKYCTFRHPPLDLTKQPAAQPAAKGRAPCYYFTHGGCVKGERCPFSHGTPAVPPKPVPAKPATQAPAVMAVPPKVQVPSKLVVPASGVKQIEPVRANGSGLPKKTPAQFLRKPVKPVEAVPRKPEGQVTRPRIPPASDRGRPTARAPPVTRPRTNPTPPSTRAMSEPRIRSPLRIEDTFDVLIDNGADYRSFREDREVYRSGPRDRSDVYEHLPGSRHVSRRTEDYLDYDRTVSATNRVAYADRTPSPAVGNSDLRNLLKRRASAGTGERNGDVEKRRRMQDRTVVEGNVVRSEFRSKAVMDAAPEWKPVPVSEDSNFEAPKSLAEIRAGKRSEPKSERVVQKVNGQHVVESARHVKVRLDSLDEKFEAPKRLDELLKEKRKSEESDQSPSKNVTPEPSFANVQESKEEMYVSSRSTKLLNSHIETVPMVVRDGPVSPVHEESTVPDSPAEDQGDMMDVNVQEDSPTKDEPFEADEDLSDEEDEFLKKMNSYLR